MGQANDEMRTEYYETNSEEGDTFLLDFEKFVSEQKVCLFGRAMGLSMLILNISCNSKTRKKPSKSNNVLG